MQRSKASESIAKIILSSPNPDKKQYGVDYYQYLLNPDRLSEPSVPYTVTEEEAEEFRQVIQSLFREVMDGLENHG